MAKILNLNRLFLCAAMRLIFLSAIALGAEPSSEVRGAWIDRSSLASREEMRATVEKLAAANFNLALVNVWSRGYPLWKSKVFEEETGMLTDPAFEGRDVLAEFVEEARRVGIAVMPWFEYGFIGGYSGYYPGSGGKGPVFERHPDWLAMTKTGETRFTAPNGFFYWMAQTRPDVQEFLLRLIEEICRNYDVVGMQFDRARYPQLDCGYDEYTGELYRREHGGASPPADHNNAEWMRWRAEKLNDFVGALYRRLKAVGRHLLVSNAPIVYPYSYVNFAQDYTAWMRMGAVDFMVPQIYRRDSAAYETELVKQLAAVNRQDILVPGIDSTNPTVDELIKMVELSRDRKLPGVVIWYYKGMLDKGALARLRETVFQRPARLPWTLGAPRPAVPRQPRKVGRQ